MLTCFYMLVHAFVSYAGNADYYSIIGFSKDGAYLAFERYGTSDGSGFPYSEILTINVAKNDYAAKPLKLVLEESDMKETIARARNLKQALPLLNKFGIVQGETGACIIKQTDALTGKKSTFITSGKIVTLILTQTPIPEQSQEYCDGSVITGNRMELTMLVQGKTIVLQKDMKLPSSRRCTDGYGIEQVWLYNDKYLAVVVRFFSPGFEGPDSRVMVVTGVIL